MRPASYDLHSMIFIYTHTLRHVSRLDPSKVPLHFKRTCLVITMVSQSLSPQVSKVSDRD